MQPQTPVSYEQFESAARIAARPAEYSRHSKDYTADVTVNGVRGWGHGIDKPSAQIAAIRNAYEHYCKRIQHENEIARFEPILDKFKPYARKRLAEFGGKVDQFRTGGFYAQLDIDYYLASLSNTHTTREHIGLYFVLATVTYEELIAKFEERIVNLAQRRTYTYLVHKARSLQDKRSARLKALPKVKPAQAVPGDVLIHESRGDYFEIVSVSPAGAKIVVWRPFGLVGPLPLEKLDKAEREATYYKTTFAELQRMMTIGERAAEVSRKIEQYKRKAEL